MPNSTLILPYVVEEKARKKPFNLDMEVSAIFCLAEARRKKPGILDASYEKISFISKLHYPVWMVPWKDSCLLVDGLEIFSHTFPSVKLPDLELFTEEIKGSVVNKEQFRDALKRHVQTFEKPKATQISLKAIFGEENLLSTLSECFEQVSLLKEGESKSVALIPPKLNEKTASERAEKAVNLWSHIQSDIKGLQYAISVLNEQMRFEEEMILREIEHVQELYKTKIAPLRPVVEKRIEKLFLKRDSKIAKLNRVTERKLTARLKEKRRHERELERLERSLIEYKERRERSKRRGDDISASKWEHRTRVYQKRLSETKKKLRSVSELIEQIRKQGELEIQKVRNDFQVLIENEKRKISDLEASRDLEVESRESQIRETQAEASIIIENIRRLIELKRSEASRIEEVTLPHRVEEVTLLCLPFYLVRYETKEKARYLILPPAVAMDFKGIVRKLQKTIHRFSMQSRIKLLLRSKSTALEKMLGKTLLKKIRTNNTLEENVYKLGVSNNLLQSSGFEKMLTQGIEELRKEGWLSREEKEVLLKTYL